MYTLRSRNHLTSVLRAVACMKGPLIAGRGLQTSVASRQCTVRMLKPELVRSAPCSTPLSPRAIVHWRDCFSHFIYSSSPALAVVQPTRSSDYTVTALTTRATTWLLRRTRNSTMTAVKPFRQKIVAKFKVCKKCKAVSQISQSILVRLTRPRNRPPPRASDTPT